MKDHCNKCGGTGMVAENEFGFDYYLPQLVAEKPCPECRKDSSSYPDPIDSNTRESNV